ncbi:hypothetical protein ACFO0U_00975 [Chromohalobacter sarecensis]|uniref:Secreted protein n=1 Tax=Chromohalobacter sarecensis TaxID=245294 RepID=A0ABV9CX84_9GAMM|nr:hypothetical protein [Chromohalobacter sarecensis]MCK0716394.1 hypothetical protein [Chromohalobacter sarecensis]
MTVTTLPKSPAVWMFLFRLRYPFIVEALYSLKKRYGGVSYVSRCRKANCRMRANVAAAFVLHRSSNGKRHHSLVGSLLSNRALPGMQRHRIMLVIDKDHP